MCHIDALWSVWLASTAASAPMLLLYYRQAYGIVRQLKTAGNFKFVEQNGILIVAVNFLEAVFVGFHYFKYIFKHFPWNYTDNSNLEVHIYCMHFGMKYTLKEYIYIFGIFIYIYIYIYIRFATHYELFLKKTPHIPTKGSFLDGLYLHLLNCH